MNNIIKNKKGFTLVELLAVIIILDVLVIVALTAVTGLMTTAKMNAFKTEILSIGQEFQTAYAAKSLTGTTSGTSYTDGLVHNTGSGNTYFCMSIKQLKDQNYINKRDITHYGG